MAYSCRRLVGDEHSYSSENEGQGLARSWDIRHQLSFLRPDHGAFLLGGLNNPFALSYVYCCLKYRLEKRARVGEQHKHNAYAD